KSRTPDGWIPGPCGAYRSVRKTWGARRGPTAHRRHGGFTGAGGCAEKIPGLRRGTGRLFIEAVFPGADEGEAKEDDSDFDCMRGYGKTVPALQVHDGGDGHDNGQHEGRRTEEKSNGEQSRS